MAAGSGVSFGVCLGCSAQAIRQSPHRYIRCGASSGFFKPCGVGSKQASSCASLRAAFCCAGTGVILSISCLRISSAVLSRQLFHPSIARLCALPRCPRLSPPRHNWPALNGRALSIGSSEGLKKMAGTLEEGDSEMFDTVIHNKQASNFS